MVLIVVGKKLDVLPVIYFCVLVTSLQKRDFDLTALISPLSFCGTVANKSRTEHLHHTFVDLTIESNLLWNFLFAIISLS